MQPIKWKPDELRDASIREPAIFAKLLQQAFASDFNSAFRYVKTQKLVLRSRLPTSVAALELEMELWLRHAPLKGKQKAQLRRHFAVCKAIQHLLDIVDQQSANLRIWHASAEDLLRALFAWVQDREKVSEELKPSSELSDGVAALRHMEFQRKALRSDCDYVTRIVNQISRLGLRETGTVEPLRSDILDAVAVAAIDDLVLHVLDCYTYKSFRVSVQGKHVELHAVKTQMEEAATWSALRGGSRTFADAIGSPWRIDDVKRLASKLTAGSDSFSDFLKCSAGRQVFQSLENVCKDHNRILRRDVEELIDLDFILRTSAGTFRADQLLDCWSFLYRVALSAHIWRSVFHKSAVPVVPESQLLVLITETLGLSVENAERLLSQFSLTPGKRNQDPFFRPLIKLNSVDRLVAGAFIETGRFARNLFTIAIREGSVDFKAKGLKPLRPVLNEFRDAGYVALINVPVSASEGTVTDVDIAATKDGYLFIGQTKVLIHPDTPYDDWRVLENLGKAAHQLDHSLGHVSLVAAKLGLRAGEYLVVPFLLTNIWDFTGATVGGFKVTDFSYLSLLLRGGEIWKVSPNPVPTREVVKLIAGRYPTGEELSRLLRRSLHEDMFRKPQIDEFTLTVGDWTITLPIDLSKRPQ